MRNQYQAIKLFCPATAVVLFADVVVSSADFPRLLSFSGCSRITREQMYMPFYSSGVDSVLDLEQT